MAEPKLILQINEKYSKEERLAIATEVIDYIVERTQSNKDYRNAPFKPYSKSYKNSTDFKAAGKSSKVDLTLSGDMLDSLKIIKEKRGEIVIGFTDKQEAGKAEGNIEGTYGQSRQVGPKRNFLGLSKKDLKENVLGNYPIRDEEARAEAVAEVELSKYLSEILAKRIKL